MARDPELRTQYLQIHNKMMEKIHHVIVSLQVANVIDMDKDDIDELANIIKQQVTFWISYCKTSTEDAVVTDQLIYQGLMKVLLLLKPYVTQEFKPSYKELEAKYRALADGSATKE